MLFLRSAEEGLGAADLKPYQRYQDAQKSLKGVVNAIERRQAQVSNSGV